MAMLRVCVDFISFSLPKNGQSSYKQEKCWKRDASTGKMLKTRLKEHQKRPNKIAKQECVSGLSQYIKRKISREENYKKR